MYAGDKSFPNPASRFSWANFLFARETCDLRALPWREISFRVSAFLLVLQIAMYTVVYIVSIFSSRRVDVQKSLMRYICIVCTQQLQTGRKEDGHETK